MVSDRWIVGWGKLPSTSWKRTLVPSRYCAIIVARNVVAGNVMKGDGDYKLRGGERGEVGGVV